MAEVILYVATSLDGYIARTDGNLDWLNAHPNPEGSDYGYAGLLDGIGDILMGRETYEAVLGFGIPWPYPGHDTHVATRRRHYPASTPRTTITPDAVALTRALREKGVKDIWLVGGGNLVQSLMAEGLVDRLVLTLIPRVLGGGIPLFPEGTAETGWDLLRTESFAGGAVSLTYTKARPADGKVTPQDLDP